MFEEFRLLMWFINDKSQHISIGILYAFLMFFISTVRSIILQHYFDRMYATGAQVRTALINVIYKKVSCF